MCVRIIGDRLSAENITSTSVKLVSVGKLN